MRESMYLNSMPRIYTLRADPKEHFIITAGLEGIARSLIVREQQLQRQYQQSFREFPNADYSRMKRSR